MPKEGGDAEREYKAMHEENLLSSWLKQDVRGQEERTAKVSEKSDEERGEKRKREEEKEENETARVQRRSNGLFSVEAFEILSREEDLESCGGLSWEYLVEKLEDLFDFEPDTLALVRVVPDVIDELVSLFSMVIKFCEVFSCCFDWEDVVPQSFSQRAIKLLYMYARRYEVWESTNESAPIIKKKKDAACAGAELE